MEYVGRAINAINLQLKATDFSDEGLIKYGQAIALKLNEKVINLLDEIRKDTADTGKVIIDCFEKQRQTVELDLNETVKEIGQCVDIPMKGVKWYMDEYVEGMDWIVNNLNTYATDLRKCDNELGLTCIVQVMEKNNLTLPVLIAYAGGRVMEIAIGVVGGVVLINDLKTCEQKVSDKYLETYSKEVFNAAVTCIDQKLYS